MVIRVADLCKDQQDPRTVPSTGRWGHTFYFSWGGGGVWPVRVLREDHGLI